MGPYEATTDNDGPEQQAHVSTERKLRIQQSTEPGS